MREVLNDKWVKFQQVLIDSDIMLQEHKEKFKNSLMIASEEFKKKTETTVQEFNNKGGNLSLFPINKSVDKLICTVRLCFYAVMAFHVRTFLFAFAFPGPFNSALNAEEALQQLKEHRNQLEALKQEENTILEGLGFFKMEQVPCKTVRMLEKVWSSTGLWS